MAKAIVLVVEDEGLIRLDAVCMIEEAGYEAIEAANADEAIRILESRTDIAVLFTDIDMPGSIDGLKLACAVRGRWPPVRLIVASGKQTLLPGDLPDDGFFLRKPYRSFELLSAINQVMATL